MESLFEGTAGKSKTLIIKGLDKLKTSNVKSMSYMFSSTCDECESADIGDISKWDTSKVESMESMFSGFCHDCSRFNSFTFSNWDTKNVKDMGYMFSRFGNSSNVPADLGIINIYADDIESMFYETYNVKLGLNVYSAPIRYGEIFKDAANKEGSLITVNYSRNTTNIDDIIATKSDNSNVVKGRLLD